MRHTTQATLAGLLLIAAAGLGGSEHPDDLTVLTEDPGEPPPGQRLYAYLEAQARRHFDTRREAVAALPGSDGLRIQVEREVLRRLETAARLFYFKPGDEAEIVTYAPGSFLYIPKEDPHYGGAEEETVIQLHGMNPFKIILPD